MFDNLLFQSAAKLLEYDIVSNTLPGAVLFCGPSSSGKLTAALETARVLSCTENPRGRWSCSCSSCLRHKALVSPNLMLLGPRDCSLEIQAARRPLSVPSPLATAMSTPPAIFSFALSESFKTASIRPFGRTATS